MKTDVDSSPGSEFVGQNLQRLRLIRDISQVDLSERAELSRVALRAIETGSSVPRIDTLARLAQALNVGVDDLLRPIRVRTGVRFRSDKRMTTRRDILARVSHVLDLYEELEAIDGGGERESLAELRRRVHERASGSEDPLALAAAARTELGVPDGGPIFDVCTTVERAGIRVMMIPVAAEGFFGLSVANRSGAIVVNTWDRISVERWIFSAAHELGHLLMDTTEYDDDATAEEAEVERRADRFASSLLMPQLAFAEAWAESRGLSLVDRVLKVKRIFRVSYKTVLYRVAEHHPQGSAVWSAFYGEYKRRYHHALERTLEPQALEQEAFREAPAVRRADEPEQLGAHDFVESRLPLLVRDAVERGDLTHRRAAEMLGLSLAEFKELRESWDT